MVRCPFPYMSSNITNPDEPGLCDQTIAENGGNTYQIFMAMWLTGILIVIILTIIQFIRLLRIRGYSLHLFATSYLHHMYILSLYNLLTLLIRMTDPMNYSGRINYTFFKILKDTSSWATYSVVLLTVCSWVKIMYQITGRSRHTIVLAERITVILTFFIFLFFGILQPQVEKGYIVFAVQMCLFVLYDVILIVIAWTHGLRVYCHLVGYEQPTSTSTSHQSSPQATTSSLSPPPPTTTTTITHPSKPPRKQKESLQQKKTRVIILLKLIFVLTICVCAAGSLQMYLGMEALKEKYHHIHNPEPYPTWKFGNLLNISGLSIVSSICSILVLIFARKFGPNSRDQSSTDINLKSNSDPRIPKSPIIDTTSRHLSQEREMKYWNIDKHIEMSSTPMNRNIIKQPSTLMLSQIGRSSQSTVMNNDVRVDISTPTSTHPTITYTTPITTPIARTSVAPVVIAEHPFQTATTSMDDITLDVSNQNRAAL